MGLFDKFMGSNDSEYENAKTESMKAELELKKNELRQRLAKAGLSEEEIEEKMKIFE